MGDGEQVLGVTDVQVSNVAVLATLELIEILECVQLDRGVRTLADMTSVELDARSRRATLQVEHEGRRDADTGSPEHLVLSVQGRPTVRVPSQWVAGVLELIDILRSEMGLGDSK